MDKKNIITRLVSLDVFRGITIVLMILVNSPGNSSAYSWLEHSSWSGCTLADLVFPFFIVIVGMSSVLALTNLQIKGFSNGQLVTQIIKRSLYIFLMGLLLNAFPHHLDFSDIRILGVLQRIAICYLCSSILFLTTTSRVQVILIIALLSCYWFLMAGFAAAHSLTINENLVGYLDRMILSSHHLYTPTFDPEGLLSTLPAIASALLGNLIGMSLLSSRTKKQQLQWMIVAGMILSTLGWLWGFIFPINKALWSSSYVLWTGGLAYLVFAFCFALIEMKRWSNWSKPFNLFGKNAMLVYVLHVLFLKIQAIILVHNNNGELINLRLYITDLLFGHLTPQNASLCYAMTYTIFWLFVLKCITEWRLLKLRQRSFAN
ncbi:MAG: heparan-alpha-glucosaminide N-acetyltransferase domain-containing protein [Legionella sp.]|nr:heparan-alpha-glucosaminide N-acetyltransferase domain-containing protein [Legionella sp.]